LEVHFEIKTLYNTKYINNKRKNNTSKSGVLHCEEILRGTNILDDWRYIFMTKDMCITRTYSSTIAL